MQTATKHENNEIFLIILKHVNRSRTPKRWAVAHENAHKTRKRRVFGHALKHVSGPNGRCRSPRMPKTMGNNS